MAKISGLCDRDEIHDAHEFVWENTGSVWSCPGQHSQCRNCDDRKCMDCVFRYHHDACEESCPDCCTNERTT